MFFISSCITQTDSSLGLVNKVVVFFFQFSGYFSLFYWEYLVKWNYTLFYKLVFAYEQVNDSVVWLSSHICVYIGFDIHIVVSVS